ncbi:MAG: 2-hydroxyacyl-CoA dehydratase [Paludibacteraceae bacterium]|nr:2-hydroxyacyl-CoA dehydratase [Paludibacteraceae bacterium]
MKLNELLQSDHFEEKEEICPGCQNHCQVRVYSFANGRQYVSGNNCERVYSNEDTTARKGINMFEEKYKMLFQQRVPTAMHSSSVSVQTESETNGQTAQRSNSPQGGLTIGIPRGLGIYENYPFWQTLFGCCGIRVLLSGTSTNRLFDKGVRTIVADNICYPAKLMHGHIMDLIDKHVDRIFYPWVVFERKEDEQSKNSFNCPVVSGYSDVIKSSINPEKNYGIPLDSPTVSFKDEALLRASLVEYLATLGINEPAAQHAVTQAIAAQQDYLNALERRNMQVFDEARAAGRMVILLAARPYHIDPLIQHKIADAIVAMGIDVITENVAAHEGQAVYDELNAMAQWAYPNRIFKAAHWVGNNPYNNLHIVELTSFGCGPDAFILDEVRAILSRYSKNLTVLKIDDVNNIGSLRLRVRSLVESVNSTPRNLEISKSRDLENKASFTTKPFEVKDKGRVILTPYFAEGYNEFLPTIFALAGYRIESLPMATQADAEEGLHVANNDICYPATIVVGSIMRALKSGKYDLTKTAVAITQTGGQCRASNYYALIKNALVAADMSQVPVIAVAIGPSLKNSQPGFEINWLHLIRPTLEALYFADALAKLYYPAAPRERIPGVARKLYDHYLNAAQPLLAKRDYRAIRRLMRDATGAFTEITDTTRQVPVVGVVGEIYVKYNSFSNHGVVRWLMEHGVEVVPPAITGFFSTSIPNAFINREQHIRMDGLKPWQARLVNRLLLHYAHVYDRLCSSYPFYRPFTDIMDIWRKSRRVINSAADFGEGWFLPGEICDLADHGIRKVVSLQPFGCIANHIISKGIERRYKEHYPDLSLLFLDFDAGTSDANITNRLHFLLQ